MQLRKIGCALDFSGPSRLAMVEAAELAAHFGAELLLLHVQEPLFGTWPGMTGPDAGELGGKYPDLEVWCAEAAEIAKSEVHASALPGSAPGLEIVKFAGEHELDLLVVGTKRRCDLPGVVFGSVAEHVVRHAPCPVLVVRPYEEAPAVVSHHQQL